MTADPKHERRAREWYYEWVDGDIKSLVAFVATVAAEARADALEEAIDVVEGSQITNSLIGPLHFAGWREGIETALMRLEALKRLRSRTLR